VCDGGLVWVATPAWRHRATHLTSSLRHCVCSLTVTAGLGEFRIRDLNDEINKRLREKRHWEDRIKELGGPDYQVCVCVCVRARVCVCVCT
jgi:hypothetical protein